MQREPLARARTRSTALRKAIAGAILVASAGLSPAQPTKPDSAPTTANAHAMCLGCHGIAGYRTAFPEVYHVPLIGGQQPAYIVNALKAYAARERSHPSMRGIAAGLSEEMARDLAQQYGTAIRPADATRSIRAIAQRGRPSEEGKTKAARLCAECHGADGNKPAGAQYPVLAGQYRDFLVRTMTDYKFGRRMNPVMKAIAAQLSTQDIEELAAWFASQPSNLHVLPR